MNPTAGFSPELLITPIPNAPYVQLGITKHGVAPLTRCSNATVAKPHMVKFHMQIVRSCDSCGDRENLELKNPRPPFQNSVPVDQGMVPLGFISSASQCFACHGYIVPETVPLIATPGLCQQCSTLVSNFQI